MQILLPLVSFITLCSVLVRGQPVAKTAPDTVWLFKRNDSTVATALNTTLVAALNSNQNNPEAGDLPLPATTAADICAPVLLNEPAAFMSNGKVDPFFNAINPAKALGQTKFAFFGRFVAVGNQASWLVSFHLCSFLGVCMQEWSMDSTSCLFECVYGSNQSRVQRQDSDSKPAGQVRLEDT